MQYGRLSDTLSFICKYFAPPHPLNLNLPHFRLPPTVPLYSVRRSDLAFRLQCRKYGAELVYSEMLDSVQYVADLQYRYYKT